MKENATSVQVEAYAKVVDDTIIRGVIIDLTNTSVMDETPEASNVAIADEVEHNTIELASKKSITSNEATYRDKGKPDVIIIYSIIIIVESFAERQRKENEQFKLSMQNTITTQFSNLCVVISQNIQHAQMSMFGVIVAPTYSSTSICTSTF
ncbi:hypothetical protein JHK86_024855 [Glycine max]|nr:hypothetical protein JHK86_024855 [Glycine max]